MVQSRSGENGGVKAAATVPLLLTAAELASSLSTEDRWMPLTFPSTMSHDDVLLSSAGSLLSSLTTDTTQQPAVNHPVITTTTAAPPPLPPTASPSTPRLNGSSSSFSSTPKYANNCFFPAEYQGTYQVQSAIDPEGRVQYGVVEIGPQDVSVWGRCHALFGQHVLTHTR